MNDDQIIAEFKPPPRTKSARIWCGFWCGSRADGNEDQARHLWGHFENDSPIHLILTGETISAQEAYRIGLVNEVVCCE
ncbi:MULTISPECIES: hypothetical protein [unclassified Bradyrhizobium]|uniref:hypothetical protein n=1 Tax=unclassified Bradyrhizobium TaxID=2631580 RepID=UPI003397E495